jgi:phosphatidyl-myo-inositol dimannoside synthase
VRRERAHVATLRHLFDLTHGRCRSSAAPAQFPTCRVPQRASPTTLRGSCAEIWNDEPMSAADERDRTTRPDPPDRQPFSSSARIGPRAKRVLFITRRFPPTVGGMETLAADVDTALRARGNVELVALRTASLRHLAWFLPWAVVRTALALMLGRIERIVCGDAIVWAPVSVVARLAGAKSSVMVLGLDLTYPNPVYQRLVHWSLPRADRVVAISSVTESAAAGHGVERSRLTVVHPGVRAPVVTAADRARRRDELLQEFALDSESLILVSLGRLVRRKGVAWFVEHVTPKLPDNAVHLIAGEGPMRAEIDARVARLASPERVRILGPVDDDERERLLTGCDISVMPNITVAGDIEGFGLVAVESACRGAVVIASALQGLLEALTDGVTGILVEAEQPEGFVSAISRLESDRTELGRLSSVFQNNARERNSVERMMRDLPAALGLSVAP